MDIVKTDIRLISRDQIQEFLVSIGEKPFRAKQIYSWLWERSARTFDEMTNLSLSLRETLKEHFVIRPIIEDVTQMSSDGTVKKRFRLHDGHLMESVLIPVTYKDRYTVCVSCQVGCSLSCSFCATGKMKRVRNLDPGEIYDQVVMINQLSLERYDHPITNIVYMGMGEPLLAYNSVLKSIEHLTSPEGLNMSPKRITVSTAGIAKMIRRLADDGVKFNLALSLHAADDAKRNEIMPINEQNNLKVLMEALQYFYDTTGNRISYEYIAFEDFNTTREDAYNLIKLCKSFPVKVNIIEYNQVEGVELRRASEEKTDKFADILMKNGVIATIRRSRGKDIDAACGQLANKG